MSLVARYVLAATLTMLIIQTFQVPGASVGGFYSLTLPRGPGGTTARAALPILTSVAISLAFVSIGTMLFVNYPLTHFLWVAGSLFIGFYVLGIATNYSAATAFIILITLTVPVWDQPVPTAVAVAANLWTAGSICIAALATIAVESIFAAFEAKDELETGLAERLTAVANYLENLSQDASLEQPVQKVKQLATVGVSRLRQIALSGPFNQDEIVRRSTAVSLIGRLVDITASVADVVHLSEQEKPRALQLSQRLNEIEAELRGPQDRLLEMAAAPSGHGEPLLRELEHTADLLKANFSQQSGVRREKDAVLPAKPPVFVPDAWSNPEHLRFALRGSAAALACYFLMNAVAWPGLGSSLFTVVVTATTSIGTSRQKQLLRFAGAVMGGVFFGIGSQMLILPALDTIAGFTVLFVSVTTFAAWFITASPRISYFGSQVGLAFYLIQLRTPFPDANLVFARDNTMGIILGLVAMWLIFDTLGAKPAVQVMREMFAKNLKLMAKLAQPWSEDGPLTLQQIRTLRENISQGFATVNAQADAVLFEVGSSRMRNLALRDQLLKRQPLLRSLFLFEIALLQYRTRVRVQELAPSILAAQRSFDREVSGELTRLAKSFAGERKAEEPHQLKRAYDELNDAVCDTYDNKPTERARAILSLSSHLVQILTSLIRDDLQDPIADAS